MSSLNPEELLLQNADARLVEQALSELPIRFREILVLRELEDLSYKEIADVRVGAIIVNSTHCDSRARWSLTSLISGAGTSGTSERRMV